MIDHGFERGFFRKSEGTWFDSRLLSSAKRTVRQVPQQTGDSGVETAEAERRVPIVKTAPRH